MNKIKVYIVDDHKIVIDGIASFFIGNPDFELIGSANSAQNLFSDLKTIEPNILLLDIKLPGLSGIQIAKIVTKEYPGIKIVFLSANTDENSLNDAISAGGVGYFSKDIDEEEFFMGLEKITAGLNYFSKGIQSTLFGTYSKQTNTVVEYRDKILSDREIEVIKLFADGLSFKEIAQKLNISTRTVESHKKNILSKLNLKTTVDLVKYAILNGLTSI